MTALAPTLQAFFTTRMAEQHVAYAAFQHPEHAGTISRVLAIPAKRRQRSDVTYLDTAETAALLQAPAACTAARAR